MLNNIKNIFQQNRNKRKILFNTVQYTCLVLEIEKKKTNIKKIFLCKLKYFCDNVYFCTKELQYVRWSLFLMVFMLFFAKSQTCYNNLSSSSQEVNHRSLFSLRALITILYYHFYIVDAAASVKYYNIVHVLASLVAVGLC